MYLEASSTWPNVTTSRHQFSAISRFLCSCAALVCACIDPQPNANARVTPRHFAFQFMAYDYTEIDLRPPSVPRSRTSAMSPGMEPLRSTFSYVAPRRDILALIAETTVRVPRRNL